MDIQGKRVHFSMAVLEKMAILVNLMDQSKKIVCRNQKSFHF
jgi:hypothetical protein